MFTVTPTDYTGTLLYFTFLVACVVVVLVVLKWKKAKKKEEPDVKKAESSEGLTLTENSGGFTLLDLILVVLSLFPILFGIVTLTNAQESAYQKNISSVEEALSKKYSGDFEVTAYVGRYIDRESINFSHLDEVASEKVPVERTVNGDIYVYRLVFDDKGQPDVIKVVTSDSVEYPPLSK